MADDLGKWVFHYAKNGEWEWRHLSRATGGEIQRGAQTFRTLHVCIADAQRHGYMPPGHDDLAAAARRRPQVSHELRAFDC
jgi:hypothetical protein